MNYLKLIKYAYALVSGGFVIVNGIKLYDEIKKIRKKRAEELIHAKEVQAEVHQMMREIMEEHEYFREKMKKENPEKYVEIMGY